MAGALHRTSQPSLRKEVPLHLAPDVLGTLVDAEAEELGMRESADLTRICECSVVRDNHWLQRAAQINRGVALAAVRGYGVAKDAAGGHSIGDASCATESLRGESV